MKAFVGIITGSRLLQALLLFIVAAVAANAGFYFLRTVPATSRAEGYMEELQGVQAEIRGNEARYREYSSYEGGEDDLARFRELLPSRSEYVDILNGVYKLAKDDNMKSSSFGTTTKETKAGGVVEVNFSMPISGSYKDVRNFIYDVESSPLFLNIRNLALSAGNEGGDISLTIDFMTYMRSDDDDPPRR